jgi:hypothetical protein
MARALDNDLFNLALEAKRVDPLCLTDAFRDIGALIEGERDARDEWTFAVLLLRPAGPAPDPRQHTLNLEVTP